MITSRDAATIRMHMLVTGGRRLALLVLCLLLPWAAAEAQGDPLAGPQRATRGDLTALVSSLEADISGGRLRGDNLSRARTRVAAIKQRLARGDFRTGDRFVVTFRQDSVRIDTASVRDSLQVTMLALPDFSLVGVLRSELDDKVNAHVSRYIRNASVRVSILTRIAVLGAVGVPGFYYAAPDRPISDVVMLAGGPAPNANLTQLTVRRGNSELLSEKQSRQALERGQTLEQLDVQSGDEVRIGTKRQINWTTILRFAVLIAGVIFSALQFLIWYANRADN